MVCSSGWRHAGGASGAWLCACRAAPPSSASAANDRILMGGFSWTFLAWSLDLLAIVTTRRGHRTGIAPRSRGLADVLAMAPQELVRPDQPGAVLLELVLQRGARRAIRGGVVLLRRPVAEP